MKMRIQKKLKDKCGFKNSTVSLTKNFVRICLWDVYREMSIQITIYLQSPTFER